MMKLIHRMTLEVADDVADRVAERLLSPRRETRRRFWSRVGYLLMLLGALGGLITALAVIWDWVG
jgi:hypothetical protein